MIPANNPALKSWIDVKENSDFPIQNIPFGIFKTDSKSDRIGTIIGDTIIDIKALNELGYFDKLGFDTDCLNDSLLNNFLSLTIKEWRALRQAISDLFVNSNSTLQNNQTHKEKVLVSDNEVTMVMPVKIGDYTDFYASKEHATNFGTMFRDPSNALLPNWLHLPVGYHGRSSSIITSGQDIYRPKGQTRPDIEQPPVYGPCKLLDFELEVGYLTGQGKPMGDSITTAEADDYIFGLVLFNDWSARDIQKWEYVPLGPFLGKSFASSISSWIVTLDALLPFRVPAPVQEVEVLPYLQYEGDKSIDLNLQAIIKTENGDENVVTNSNFKYMYWTMQQQLAHHTVNGCNINAGDMLASGTISGPTPDSYGSMIELSWKGTKPLTMKDGTERKFIADNDTIIMRGYCQNNDVRIGFGEVNNKVLPAK
ncbi:UNVERIFIED_CONTAM: hypothetical protein GTU68_045107 [Idotea baltica]|nr:hypothetical protein [Idotea baltica]